MNARSQRSNDRSRLIAGALAYVAALIAGSGCVTDSVAPTLEKSPVRNVDYVVSSSDSPEHRRFDVTIQALTKREMCTGPGLWPSPTGHIGGSGLKITARVDGITYTYRDTDMEMCAFRACQDPISSGSKIQSVLTYEGFGLPDANRFAAKELTFEPQPYWCTARTP